MIIQIGKLEQRFNWIGHHQDTCLVESNTSSVSFCILKTLIKTNHFPPPRANSDLIKAIRGSEREVYGEEREVVAWIHRVRASG